MARRTADRFRASKRARDEAVAELERALLQELWDAPDRMSAMGMQPCIVPPPPPEPMLTEGQKTLIKKAIAILAPIIAGAIMAALQMMGATSTYKPPQRDPVVIPSATTGQRDEESPPSAQGLPR